MTDKQQDVFEAQVEQGPYQSQGTALTPVGENMPAPQSRAGMEAMLEQANLAVEFQNRIKQIALKLTNESDWCFLGKKFFLENTGAKKMMQAFGVSVYPDGPQTSERFKDDLGEYIVITVPMRAVWKNSEVSEKGICSTRDKLLGTVGGGYKPLSEVSITNVTLKAQTSAIRRAVMSVLALNPSEEDMTLAGLNLNKIKEERGVSYGGGSQGGNVDSKELTERKKKVQAMLIEIYGKDQYESALEDLTSFKAKDGTDVKGKRSLRAVSEKQFTFLERDVKKMYADHTKSSDGE
jgi:hypothetical protein